jgi:hypothetical protein
MLKIITLAAAAAAVLTVSAVSGQAVARDRGGAVAAGVIGGLAAGAIIGSAAQRNYYGGPAYVEPGYQPVYGPCHWEREQVVDQWGRYRTRRIRVCE